MGGWTIKIHWLHCICCDFKLVSFGTHIYIYIYRVVSVSDLSFSQFQVIDVLLCQPTQLGYELNNQIITKIVNNIGYICGFLQYLDWVIPSSKYCKKTLQDPKMNGSKTKSGIFRHGFITQMLHGAGIFTYIYLQNWVIYGVNVWIHIPAPWFTYGL